jgi:hypothetical protein
MKACLLSNSVWQYSQTSRACLNWLQAQSCRYLQPLPLVRGTSSTDENSMKPCCTPTHLQVCNVNGCAPPLVSAQPAGGFSQRAHCGLTTTAAQTITAPGQHGVVQRGATTLRQGCDLVGAHCCSWEGAILFGFLAKQWLMWTFYGSMATCLYVEMLCRGCGPGSGAQDSVWVS